MVIQSSISKEYNMIMAMQLSEIDQLFRALDSQPSVELLNQLFSLLNITYRKLSGLMEAEDSEKVKDSFTKFKQLKIQLLEQMSADNPENRIPPTLREMWLLQSYLETCHSCILDTMRKQKYTYITK